MISAREQKHLRLQRAVLEDKQIAVKNDTMIRMQKKADESVFKNMLELQRYETETERTLASAKESTNWRNDELEQEEKLANEISKVRLDRIRKLKARQLLMNCTDVQEIEKKFASAYMLKCLQGQIAAKKALQKEEREKEDKEIEAQIKKCKEESEFEERSTIVKEAQRKMLYRNELQDQIISNYKLKQTQYLDYLREKSLIDDTVRSIQEENQRALEIQREKQKRAKEEFQAIREARILWLKKEKEKLEEEDRAIEQYLAEKEAREIAFQEKKDAELRALNIKRSRSAQIMLDSHKNSRDRENIAIELMRYEADRMERLKDKQKEEKLLKDKLETQAYFKELNASKLRELEKQKEEDMILLQRMKQTVKEDDKKEAMLKHKRHQEAIAYGQHLRSTMEEKALMEIEESEKERLLNNISEEAYKEKMKLVNEYRIELLKQHAENLIGCIPIRPEDVQHLSPKVQEYLKGQ